MANIPAPGVLEVIQYFSSGVANGANVMHVVKGSGVWEVADIDAVLDVFETWEDGDANANRSNQVQTTGFRATDLTSLAGRSVFRGVTIVGSSPFPVLPLNSTWAVKLQTGMRGRGTNGRMFWYGLMKTGTNAYTIDATLANGIRDSVNNLITALGAAGDYALCVLHKEALGVPLDPQTNDVVLDASYTDLTLDSQRDRLPGHKRHKRSVPPT